jgi:L-lactate dehydrogenase complex protein LldG
MSNASMLIETFRRKAEAVSAVVHAVADMAAALAYSVDLCRDKQACQMLLAGCEVPLSVSAGRLCEGKPPKTLAAPNLGARDHATLATLCREKGITLVKDDLHRHLGGIDMGLTVVDFGIAATGTLVLTSNDEQLRLATMISEIHVAILPVARLKATAFDIEADLAGPMSRPPGYLAFITGASRTADIERVLALGVHGPLALHILLLADSP